MYYNASVWQLLLVIHCGLSINYVMLSWMGSVTLLFVFGLDLYTNSLQERNQKNIKWFSWGKDKEVTKKWKELIWRTTSNFEDIKYKETENNLETITKFYGKNIHTIYDCKRENSRSVALLQMSWPGWNDQVEKQEKGLFWKNGWWNRLREIWTGYFIRTEGYW